MLILNCSGKCKKCKKYYTPRDKLHQPVIHVKGMYKKGFAVNVILFSIFYSIYSNKTWLNIIIFYSWILLAFAKFYNAFEKIIFFTELFFHPQ